MARACASGDGCGEAAGHGNTRLFCPRHARQLAEIRDRDAAPKRKAPAASRPPQRQRLPRHVRAERVGRHVAAAGWVSRAEAANAAGVQTSALAPIIRIAREAGWIETQGNAGYRRGPVEPPAAAAP